MSDENEDPAAPLEDVTPLDVEPVPGDGEQPPSEWGEQGEGGDSEDATSEAVPQDGD